MHDRVPHISVHVIVPYPPSGRAPRTAQRPSGTKFVPAGAGQPLLTALASRCWATCVTALAATAVCAGGRATARTSSSMLAAAHWGCRSDSEVCALSTTSAAAPSLPPPLPPLLHLGTAPGCNQAQVLCPCRRSTTTKRTVSLVRVPTGESRALRLSSSSLGRHACKASAAIQICWCGWCAQDGVQGDEQGDQGGGGA